MIVALQILEILGIMYYRLNPTVPSFPVYIKDIVISIIYRRSGNFLSLIIYCYLQFYLLIYLNLERKFFLFCIVLQYLIRFCKL